MVIKFFDTAAATEAGESLAKIVMESLPVTPNENDAKQAKAITNSMRKVSQQVEWLKLQHKFNFLQKAKLGTVLRWKLTDAGYSEAYAKELTEWVLMRLK